MPGLQDAFERIGDVLERRLPLTHAAGVALAVTDADEILGVVVRGFADAASGTPVTPTTRFQIGSISKSFAGLVAVQEARAGRLDLQASVNTLLPWLDQPEPFGPITLHHLMTHTAGIVTGTEQSPTELGAVRILRDQRVGFAPGERFWYSNDAWKLVGLALRGVTGLPAHELIRQRVLEPLGMTSSTAAITNDVRRDIATGYQTIFDDRPPRTTHPLVPAPWEVSRSADGSIVSNVLDMTSYARMILAGGSPLLDDDGFALLTAPAAEDEDWPTFRYGYGLWVGEEDGRRRIWHSGSMISHAALLIVDPDDGLACVMLMNGYGERRSTVRFALLAVRGALAGGDPSVMTPRPSLHRVSGAEAYVGRYRGRERSFAIETDGDGLAMVDGNRRVRLEVVDGGTDVFLLDDDELDRFPLRFGRDSVGAVVEALHGDDWLVNERWSGDEPGEAPPDWRAYPGLYRRANGWGPTLRVVLRKARLVVEPADIDEPAEELVPLDDGWFHVGLAAWKPQWVRFGDVVDGRATTLTSDGGVWYRSFEE